MAIPHVEAGKVAQAAQQNALIDSVNANADSVTEHTSQLAANTSSLTTQGKRIAALEAKPAGSDAGRYFGQWTDLNDGRTNQTISTKGGTKVTEINVPLGTATGCTLAAGTLTVQQPGLWLVMASLQYGTGTSVRAMWLSKGNAASNPSGKYGSVAGPSMDVQSADAVFRLAAGDSVSVYSAVWQDGAPIGIYRALSNNLTALWLGP